MGKKSRAKQESRQSGGSQPKSQRPSPAAVRSKEKNIPFFWIVLGVIAVTFLVIIALLPSDSEEKQGAFSKKVGVSGTSLEMYGSEKNDPAIGEPFPTVSGVDTTGKKMKIAPNGSPMAVLVLAHWCPHCQKEVPLLQDWLEKNKVPKGVKLYALATGSDATRENFPPQKWLKKEKWQVRTMLDDKDGTGGEQLGTNSFPYFIFVDKDGNVQKRTSGEITMKKWAQLLKDVSQA